MPGAQLECLGSPDADQRTYKASFEKVTRLLPEFRPQWGVEAGAAQLVAELRRRGLTETEFKSPRFTRMQWLQGLIGAGRVDAELRLREGAPA